MDEAVAWARRAPNSMSGNKSEMEIRPFYEAAEASMRWPAPKRLAAA